MNRISFSLLLSFVFACAGGPKGDTGGGGTAGGGSGNGDVSDLDVDDATTSVGGDAGALGGDAMPAEEAVLTVILKNTHATEDLAFNLDRGYGGFIAMYSGKPPNATSVLPFAKHCTAACEVPEEERCPSCPEPEDLKEIRKAQKLERVAPGEELEVRWDGNIHTYEKTQGTREGKKARCECYTTEPVPVETYTIRACGLRLTQTAKKRSKLQCQTAEIELPPEEPERLELEFGKP